MDLKTFDFPSLNDTQAVRKAAAELLEEAKERGFYNGNTAHNDLFNTLFFSGGDIEFRKDLTEEFKDKAWPFCRGFMSSFDPKHEHKEAVCAMLMSEILVAKKKKKLWLSGSNNYSKDRDIS